MRRAFVVGAGLLLVLAVGTRVAESLGLGGARLRCACQDTCWCERPSLTLFRWVTPGRWHRLGVGPD